jgi:uncharacterized protein (TIGR03435 family)
MGFCKRQLPPAGLAAILVLSSGIALRAQAPAVKRAAFEVTSAKLNKNCDGHSARPVLSPGTFHLPCVSVRSLITGAYGAFSGENLKARATEIVGGPSWIDSERYDVDGKPESKATMGEMVGPMLQSLLEDRFQLKLHKEGRETSVFFLTVSEPNASLRQSKPGDCVPVDLFAISAGVQPSPEKQCGGMRGSVSSKGGGMALDFFGITMDEFSGRMLGDFAGRPVIDKTGLAGRFDFHLEFSPQPPTGPVMLNGQPAVLPPSSPMDSGESIFSALPKQLGLKLTAGKAPIDVLVIDRVERPSEN